MNAARNERLIYAILALVVISWGLNIVIVKVLVQNHSPLLVSAVRQLLAGAILLPFSLRKFGFYQPTGKQWALLIMIGLTSVFAHQWFVAYGVASTSATNASLILGLNPLTTALLAAAFIGETINRRLLLGILLGFSGVVLVVASHAPGASIGLSGWGDFIMVLAMLAYVAGSLFVKKVSETGIPTLVVTAYSTMIGGVLLNMGTVVIEPSSYSRMHFSAGAWALILLSAWGASALGALGWYHGIKRLGANKSAIFLNGMPFASMVGGVIFLGEQIRWIHILAFILITSGIVLGTVKRKKRQAVAMPRVLR